MAASALGRTGNELFFVFLYFYCRADKKLRIMKQLRFIVFALTASLASPLFGQQADIDTLMKHIQKLASEEFAGRMAGTEGYFKAAEYVAGTLRRYGVEPCDEDGSWSQLFEVECNEVENCSLETYVNENDVRTTYVLGRDFVCAGMTGRGYTDAQVVFCGYGIDHPAFNEYAQVDARGKIVLVLTGVPSFLPTKVTGAYASLRDKARVARAHGAVALVAVNMAENCRHDEVQSHIFSGFGSHQPTFPILLPTRRCGERLLQDEDRDIDSTLALINANHSPQSYLLHKRFAININAKYQPKALTGNVVGIMKGGDRRLQKEIIVVGAHLDHVGMQGETCLFPGADDNASGIAALLETARLLAASDEKPRRSVVFVCFSGAESQYLGSQIFVSNFPQLHRIDAFINIECVGNGDSLAVLGNKRFPALWEVARRNDSLYTQRMVHGFKTMPKGDAIAFTQVGVPSLVFSTFNGNRYAHVPSDIPENIDRNLIQQAATLVWRTVNELCQGDYQGRDPKTRKIKL